MRIVIHPADEDEAAEVDDIRDWIHDGEFDSTITVEVAGL
jgi:hypothetical protein